MRDSKEKALQLYNKSGIPSSYEAIGNCVTVDHCTDNHLCKYSSIDLSVIK